MLPTLAALVTAAAFGAADLRATNHAFAELPAFVARAAPVVPGAFTLRSPMLEGQAFAHATADERDAQHHRHRHGGSSSGTEATPGDTAAPADGATADTAAPTAASSSSTTAAEPTTTPAATSHPAASGAAATTEASAPSTPPGAEDAAAAPADDEPDIELIRHREHQVRTHRILGFTTLGSLVVTEVLGTLAAIKDGTLINRPCLDSMGQSCIQFDPLVPLHLTSAFLTVSLYGATGIFALTMPDPEHASAGHDSRGDRLRWHQRLAWIHFSGMVLLPILGIAASMPAVFGVPASGVGEFTNVMRTLHLGVGYITLAALTTAMVFEL